MKICCFLFDPNVGGPTVRARQVYEKMISQGHEVIVAFPQGEGSALSYIEEAGIDTEKLVIRKPVLPSKKREFALFILTLPRAIWRTVRFLKKARPDVVHVNGAFDFVPAVSAKLAGVPLVWNLNDTLFSKRFSSILGYVVGKMSDITAIAAIKVGEHYAVPENKSMVLYEPVDTDKFLPRDVEILAEDRIVVGQLANWNWIKGQDRLLEVMLLLREQDSRFKAKVIGHLVPSQEQYWQPIISKINALGLADNFEVFGFSQDVAADLPDIDIAVLTSRSEACPLCVLEAMAVGIPQVVFDVGGVRELLGEGENAAGIVVPNGDIKKMADAISRLATDADLYHRCSAAGKARARDKFSLDACVQRHQEIYEAAISD